MADPAELAPQSSSSERAMEAGEDRAGEAPSSPRTPGREPRPARGSRRAHFERSPAPSPSRAGQGGGNSLEDQLLEALLHKNLPKFEELARDKRVDKNHKYGTPHYRTCLEIACCYPDRGDFVRLLLKYVKPNVNRVIPEPIHFAAQRGNHDSLRALLSDKRTKVYALNSKGQTALHLACASVSAKRVDDYAKCVELLIPKMSVADLNKPDSNGFTAFHTLVRIPGKSASKSRKSRVGNGGEDSPEDDASSCQETGESGASADGEARARERVAALMLRMAQGALDLDAVRARGRTAREEVECRLPALQAQLPPPRRPLPHADPLAALVRALHDGDLRLFRALLQQTDADGNPVLDPDRYLGYPLHCTALELAVKRSDGAPFVRALMEAGADPNVPNQLNEKYPVHVACEMGHYEELKALFEFSKVTDPNCGDRFGNTPLHCAVDRISDDKRRETGRRRCLEFLLTLDDLDVQRTNNAGYTALMLAAEDENESVIRIFLRAKKHFGDLNLETLKETSGMSLRDFFVNKCYGSSVKTFLGQPGNEAMTLRRRKTKELFELLNPAREDDFVKHIKEHTPSDFKISDKNSTLLQRAATFGMEKAVEALLDAGANPNEILPTCNASPPGVLASYHRHYNVLNVLLQHKNFDVNSKDAKGNTALHYATREGQNLEMVILLLRHGANMFCRNNLGKSPFGAEQVQSLLDQCVGTNDKNAREEDYEIVLDYRLLAPGPLPKCEIKARGNYTAVSTHEEDEKNAVEVDIVNDDTECRKLKSEMGFLNMMRKCDDLSSLLDHPIVLSFLSLKWNRLRYMAYFNLGVYIMFILFLNIFIVSETHKARRSLIYNTTSVYRAGKRISPENLTISFGTCALFFWTILCVREFFQFILDPRKYIKSWENYLDWSVLSFSLLSLMLPFLDADRETSRTINVVTIMISCAELLFLLRRISHFAKYIEMLKVVILNYMFPLVSYIVIIISFGLSFHTLCYEARSYELVTTPEKNLSDGTNFESWYMSIVTTLVMMTGELEFQSFPDKSVQPMILFMVFLFLVTVVLLNLLIGLAVSDTARIEDAAQKLRLQSRVEVVLRCESILVNMHNSECAAARRVRRALRGWLRRALLFPGPGLQGREGRVKPNQKEVEVVLGEGACLSGDLRERRPLDRESLDRATQILRRRGAEEAQTVSLSEVDAGVKEVLKTLKTLEARCGPGPRGSQRLFSQLSVFSDVPNDEFAGDSLAGDQAPQDEAAAGAAASDP